MTVAMTINPDKSALNVMKGIDQPSQINDEAVRKLKSEKHKSLSAEEFVKGIGQATGPFSAKRSRLLKVPFILTRKRRRK